MDRRRNGIQDDGKVQALGVPPSMRAFLQQNLAVPIIELGDAVHGAGVLGDKGSLLKQRQDVHELIAVRKMGDLVEQAVFRDSA